MAKAHQFSDREGRKYTVDITVADMKRVRAAAGVDLFDAFADDYDGFDKLMADPVLLIDVVYVLVADQAKAYGLDDVGFGKSISGDPIREVGDAFREALIDFFPDARAREVVRATLNKALELRDLRIELLKQAVAQVDVRRLAEISSNGSTNSPESSASTPAPSPSRSLKSWPTRGASSNGPKRRASWRCWLTGFFRRNR